MRILLTLVAVVAFMASATAQETKSDKKVRKVAKSEAVSVAPDAAPKAGCCAGKAGASAEAGKSSCAGKAGMTDASTGAAEGGAKLESAAGTVKTAACCAGKSKEEMKSCHGEGKAHAHEHGEKTEEAPAVKPSK